MSPKPQTRAPDELLLIDGNSLAYRAFFALPESIATSTGVPTNAIFGLASMLVKLLTEIGHRPTIVVWDGGDSGRKTLYPDYKAQRSSRPDLLREQWPHFEPLVEAFGYTNLRVEGFEADDVIASIAAVAPCPVLVLTGDRDAFQLVNDRTRILAPGRGITDTKLYDVQAVIDRYGITPAQVPDFIGLKGDSSDNIPGVPGIGDKTAAELLRRFENVEGVLRNIDQISGAKRKQNLTEHADIARLSKQLATAQRDIPVELDLAAITHAGPDRSALRDTFRRFELREPLRRLEEALGSPEAAAPSPAPAGGAPGALGARVRTVELAELSTGLPAADIAVALAAPEAPEGALFGEVSEWTFAVAAPPGAEILTGGCSGPAELLSALGARTVITHDAKSLGLVPALAHDTEIAAYLLEPARRAYPFRELVEERGLSSDLEGVPATALLLHHLASWQREQIHARGLDELFRTVELPLVRILRKMELAGLKLDTGALAEISARVKAEADTLEGEIHALADEEFTLGSPRQLEEILFSKLGLTRKRRGKTGYSTDARVLQAIRDEHPIVPKIERWRELTKLAQTYLDALPLLISPADGRIHTTLNQTAAATGRLSSNNPNLQNIPIRTPLGREIRACFIAEPGHLLVSADYSQVELRLLAHIAGEEVLKDIFRAGEDVHTATAMRVFGVSAGAIDPGMRSKAKMINYGIVYGLSAYGMADRLDIPQAEADEFITRYMAGFPAVSAFIEATIEHGTELGYVSTLLGRRRQVPELRARRWELRKQGERFAVNMVIQGTAADIMKIAMVRADAALAASGLAARLVLQIHDELLFEAPAEEAETVRALAIDAMAGAFTMDPPLEVEAGIGPDWLSAK
ncbi:DNA polymerase I [Conexibacter sp. DBS9H8]|uniref:DNA polymerase I n=1 Tax=Conexibacter sp. DBS9H8 TaxID=2937801 RepID=UPI00200EBAC2|nr:DNA polymerase I [Conexibacter sp. DBS9H8]